MKMTIENAKKNHNVDDANNLIHAHPLDDSTEVRSQHIVHLFQLRVHIGQLKHKQTMKHAQR